jgi:hypothetical protein
VRQTNTPQPFGILSIVGRWIGASYFFAPPETPPLRPNTAQRSSAEKDIALRKLADSLLARRIKHGFAHAALQGLDMDTVMDAADRDSASEPSTLEDLLEEMTLVHFFSQIVPLLI